MTDTHFSQYGKYYNAFNQEKNYRAEVEYVCSLFKIHNKEVNSLLEFGSGTGNHAKFFTQNNISVHGIELSEEMVANALSLDNFHLVQGDIRTSVFEKKFDAVVSLFHVISYLTSNDDVIATFNNASRHLVSGGLFVFDVWYSPAVHHLQPLTRVKRAKVESTNLIRIAEPNHKVNENVVDIGFTFLVDEENSNQYHMFTELHPMRHFTLQEIKLFGQLSGLELIAAEEFLTGEKPGKETWGVCSIMRKL